MEAMLRWKQHLLHAMLYPERVQTEHQYIRDEQYQFLMVGNYIWVFVPK